MDGKIASVLSPASQRYVVLSPCAKRARSASVIPAELGDEMIRLTIERAHRKGRKVGLCGQAPSDHPEFARFLADAKIDSISVTPDALPQVLRVLAANQSDGGQRS